MVAEASLANLAPVQVPDNISAEKRARSIMARRSTNAELAEIQLAMYALAMDDSLEPAKRTAAANAFVNLEERRRMNLGKANPAPVKSEPKRGKRSGGALRPAVVQVQPEPEPPAFRQQLSNPLPAQPPNPPVV